MKNQRYTPKQLNDAADLYRHALCLSLAMPPGEVDPKIEQVKENAGNAIIKYVEPLLLTYFRFLTGQKDYKGNREIERLLLLFNNERGVKPDFEKLALRVVTGVKAVIADGDSDSTVDPKEFPSYQGNEIYSWFMEIIFTEILPNYKIMYKDDGVTRINFFKYFSDKFRYSLSSRIKKEIGWRGRVSSLEDKSENENFQPLDLSSVNLKDEVGMPDLEWEYFQAMIRPERGRSRRQVKTRCQELLESRIAGYILQFRKDQSEGYSRLDIYRH